jgi:acyl carrier protein
MPPKRWSCREAHAAQLENASPHGTLRPDHRDRQKGQTPVTNEEILNGIAEIVNEVAGVETSEITPDKSFVDELDIDSLSMVEIAVQVEDRFGVKVPDDVLANLKTVGDAVDYVAKTTT